MFLARIPLATGLALALLASAPAQAEAGPGLQAATQGQWRFASDPAAYEAHAHQAVETAVAEVNFAIRGIARGRLHKLSGACALYTFDLSSTHFTYTCQGYDPVVAPLDGSTTTYTKADGEVVSLALQAQSNRVVVTFQAENGGQRTVFDFGEAELHLTREITSEYLPKPVIYEARYAS